MYAYKLMYVCVVTSLISSSYVCVCVCVCVCVYVYIYICLYICMCVCICVYADKYTCVSLFTSLIFSSHGSFLSLLNIHIHIDIHV